MLAMTTALTIQTFRTQDRALRLRSRPRAPHIVPQTTDWRHLSPGLALALLLVAGMMWGGGNVASKTVLLHVGPLTTLALRCTLAFAIILALLQPWQRARQSVPFTASFLKSACGVALLFAGALVLQQCAYRWTSVTNASFLVNTCAVLTPVIAWVWLGQRPKASVALAGGAILFGAFLMSGMARAGTHIGAELKFGPRDTGGEAAHGAKAIEVADAGAGVAAQVVILALHLVEFFDDGEGNDDIVFLEHEECIGVVKQDVGIKHKLLGINVRGFGDLGCRR